MVTTERRKRKQWATASAAKLRRAYRRDAAHVTAPEKATKKEVQEHRRAEASPRQVMADYWFPQLMKICLREMPGGIYMRGPARDGETIWEREPTFQRTPMALEQETISAAQFGVEWALLYAEAMAWASTQVEPDTSVGLSDEDSEAIRELTGNMPSMIVSRWCNAILSGQGKRRERKERHFQTEGGAVWDDIIRALEESA